MNLGGGGCGVLAMIIKEADGNENGVLDWYQIHVQVTLITKLLVNNTNWLARTHPSTIVELLELLKRNTPIYRLLCYFRRDGGYI